MEIALLKADGKEDESSFGPGGNEFMLETGGPSAMRTGSREAKMLKEHDNATAARLGKRIYKSSLTGRPLLQWT